MPQTANLSNSLNLITRKQKNVVKLFGGLASPFYYSAAALPEGTVVKLGTIQDLIVPCVAGNSDGPLAIGFCSQEVYDDSAYGQLRGYNFVNDTRVSLSSGGYTGVLTGQGYALVRNYIGTVAWNLPAYLDATSNAPAGRLTATAGPAGDRVNVVFEGAAVAGEIDPNIADYTYGQATTPLVRVRFDFKMC